MKKITVGIILIGALLVGSIMYTSGFLNLNRTVSETTITDGKILNIMLEGSSLEKMATNKITSVLGYEMYFPKDMEYVNNNSADTFIVNDLTLIVSMNLKDDDTSGSSNTNMNSSIRDNTTNNMETTMLGTYTAKYNNANINGFINETYYIESSDKIYRININYPIEYTEGYRARLKECLNTFKIK